MAPGAPPDEAAARLELASKEAGWTGSRVSCDAGVWSELAPEALGSVHPPPEGIRGGGVGIGSGPGGIRTGRRRAARTVGGRGGVGRGGGVLRVGGGCGSPGMRLLLRVTVYRLRVTRSGSTEASPGRCRNRNKGVRYGPWIGHAEARSRVFADAWAYAQWLSQPGTDRLNWTSNPADGHLAPLRARGKTVCNNFS